VLKNFDPAQAMDELSSYIVDPKGDERELKIPLGIAMSLMEALKAFDEPVEATCGGMALCASCLVDITDGFDNTGELTLDEEAMLDTLPEYNERFRLSCQINVDADLDGLRIQYIAAS